MATLSSVTAWTRSLIKWVGVAAGAILLLVLLYRIFVFVKGKITPPPPPTVSFGKLPPISFAQSQTEKALSFSIDTVTGVLPVFSDRASVYKTSPVVSDLLALDKATKKVNAIGFTGPYSKISESLYQWSAADQNSGLSKKITYNIFSSDFNLSSTFLSDPQVLAANNLPNQTAAVDTAENFLSNMGSQPQDIDLEKTQTEILSIQNGTLVPATSLSNTQVLQVSFLQKNLNGLPIAYPNTNSSTINVFVAGGGNGPQVVKVDFFHQNISSDSATYPILSASEAFDKLKNGDSYIVSYDGISQKISINKVFLAYFLSDSRQTYVMPVVVFEGNGFAAYVSAVRDAWTQK